MADEQRQLASSAELGRAGVPFDVVRRGYDREQVLEHLGRAEERAAELESRLEEALIQLAETRRDLVEARRAPEPSSAERDPLGGVAEHLLEVVRSFDDDVTRLRRRAELEATGLLAEARTEAARMRLDAQGEEERARTLAEELLGEAEREAESIRAQLAPLRELTLSQARAIRDRMRISLIELDAILPADAEPQVIVLEDPVETPAPPPDPSPA
jgi:hypothetical protein